MGWVGVGMGRGRDALVGVIAPIIPNYAITAITAFQNH